MIAILKCHSEEAMRPKNLFYAYFRILHPDASTVFSIGIQNEKMPILA